jgi:hypothetical protein
MLTRCIWPVSRDTMLHCQLSASFISEVLKDACGNQKYQDCRFTLRPKPVFTCWKWWFVIPIGFFFCVVYRRFGRACCMLAQGQQSRLKSTRLYPYPCWLVTPRICIISLAVDHVVSRAFVWMTNDERMSCSHGPKVCWHFNASRYVVWSVMTCVCERERERVRACVRSPWWRHIECGSSAGRCIAQLYCGILIQCRHCVVVSVWTWWRH